MTSTLTWSADGTASPTEVLANHTYNLEPPSPDGSRRWPAGPEYANSTAVSRAVNLVAGQRYWMLLECTMAERDDTTCGVGTRILAPNSLHAASLASPARRWQPRARSTQSCSAITDKTECCAAVDINGDICVPAVASFADGAVCAGWGALQQQVAQQSSLTTTNRVASCPPGIDPSTATAQPRTTLTSGTPCTSITDKVACCSATDGRVGGSTHVDAPCVPAVTRFESGAVCESASVGGWLPPPTPPSPVSWTTYANMRSDGHPAGGPQPTSMVFSLEEAQARCAALSTCAAVTCSETARYCGLRAGATLATSHSWDSTQYSYLLHRTEIAPLGLSAASCAELGGDGPITTAIGEEAVVITDVQQLTLTQASPAKLTQRMTMTMIDCPAGTDCGVSSIGGQVSLQHNGQASTALGLSASAAEISSAFVAIRDSTYSALAVTSIIYTNSTIVWTMELTTPWAACSSDVVHRPLISAAGSAKVIVTTVITAGSSCLDGGLDLSLTGGNGSSSFMSWHATPDVLTATLNRSVLPLLITSLGRLKCPPNPKLPWYHVAGYSERPPPLRECMSSVVEMVTRRPHSPSTSSVVAPFHCCTRSAAPLTRSPSVLTPLTS